MLESIQNITDFIPSLIKNIEVLEAQLDHIAERWIGGELVLSVMKTHDISPAFFKDEYATKVLEYFFGVVKKEKEVGACPVIDKLLLYLKGKDVSADELFIICAHARKAMIDETFRQKIASYKLISEVSLLFDLNFSGVLKQYANTIYKLQKQVDEELKRNREKDAFILQQSRLAQMGEMISMIAHQWRQPLGAIAANSMDLKMQSEFGRFSARKNEDFKGYQEYVNKGLGEIDAVVKQLTRTIDDFRNIGKSDEAYELTSLSEVCEKALKIVRVSFQSKDIEIIENYDSSVKYKMRPSEMIRAILNIFNNAQENFKEKGTQNPRVSVFANKNSIAIRDNGGGIPENILPKIFDPYFSTKDAKNGTGLGLYSSKTIVQERHKGSLEAENAEDGVCFTIRFRDDEI
jgi:signal transduction histidine kinase